MIRKILNHVLDNTQEKSIININNIENIISNPLKIGSAMSMSMLACESEWLTPIPIHSLHERDHECNECEWANGRDMNDGDLLTTAIPFGGCQVNGPKVAKFLDR